MTINPIATNIAWSTEYTTTGVTDKIAGASCTNTATLAAKGNKYPAATKADNYNFGGKKWCLPSYDILKNMTNSTNFTKINTGMITAGGSILGNISGNYVWIWSSSEISESSAGALFVSSSGETRIGGYDKTETLTTKSTRPVFAF